MMTRLRITLKAASISILMAISLAGHADNARAGQDWGSWGPALVTDNSLFATNQPAGCSTGASNALANAGNYTYAQSYAAIYNLVHQPTTYFGCLQNILNTAQKFLNMFNDSGNVNIGTLFRQLAQAAINQLMTYLSNQVCQMAGSTMSVLSPFQYTDPNTGITSMISSISSLAGGSGAGANIISTITTPVIPTP